MLDSKDAGYFVFMVIMFIPASVVFIAMVRETIKQYKK